MKKSVIKLAVVVLCSLTLMSCVTRNKCPTRTDAGGQEYLDRNACTSTVYLAGLIPVG